MLRRLIFLVGLSFIFCTLFFSGSFFDANSSTYPRIQVCAWKRSAKTKSHFLPLLPFQANDVRVGQSVSLEEYSIGNLVPSFPILAPKRGLHLEASLPFEWSPPDNQPEVRSCENIVPQTFPGSDGRLERREYENRLEEIRAQIVEKISGLLNVSNESLTSGSPQSLDQIDPHIYLHLPNSLLEKFHSVLILRSPNSYQTDSPYQHRHISLSNFPSRAGESPRLSRIFSIFDITDFLIQIVPPLHNHLPRLWPSLEVKTVPIIPPVIVKMDLMGVQEVFKVYHHSSPCDLSFNLLRASSSSTGTEPLGFVHSVSYGQQFYLKIAAEVMDPPRRPHYEDEVFSDIHQTVTGHIPLSKFKESHPSVALDISVIWPYNLSLWLRLLERVEPSDLKDDEDDAKNKSSSSHPRSFSDGLKIISEGNSPAHLLNATIDDLIFFLRNWRRVQLFLPIDQHHPVSVEVRSHLFSDLKSFIQYRDLLISNSSRDQPTVTLKQSAQKEEEEEEEEEAKTEAEAEEIPDGKKEAEKEEDRRTKDSLLSLTEFFLSGTRSALEVSRRFFGFIVVNLVIHAVYLLEFFNLALDLDFESIKADLMEFHPNGSLLIVEKGQPSFPFERLELFSSSECLVGSLPPVPLIELKMNAYTMIIITGILCITVCLLLSACSVFYQLVAAGELDRPRFIHFFEYNYRIKLLYIWPFGDELDHIPDLDHLHND